MALDYRSAGNQMDRLPSLATDPVLRKVAVIFATGGLPCSRARRQPDDPRRLRGPDNPVKLGLVTSLARPGGNLTGVNFFTGELTAKRLDLLREWFPEWLALPYS